MSILQGVSPAKWLLLLWVLFFSSTGVALGDSNVKVIANASVDVSVLSPSQLRRIFSMRQTTWPNGDTIRVVVMRNDNPLHEKLCKDVLGVFPYQMERQWNRLAFSGLGDLPVVVENELQMLEYIRGHRGAVGYVTQGLSTDELATIGVAKDTP